MTMSRVPLPDSYEGLLIRAQTAHSAGNVERAIALYRRLIEKLSRLSDRIITRRPGLRDLHLQASLGLADLFHQQERWDEAIEVKEALLETHPDQAHTWRRDVAILRLAKGEAKEGLAELRALTEEDPDEAWNWVALGNEARIEGRFRESQQALDRALKVAGKDGPDKLDSVYYHRFLLFKDMKRPDEALDAWNGAVGLNPNLESTVRKVYTMLTAAGRYSEALHYVARDNNVLQAGFQRGLIAYLTGDAAEAQREWRAVTSLDPADFGGGQDCWVEAVLRLGDPVPVLESLQELLQRHGSVRLLVLVGIAWAMYGNQRLAQMLFEQAISVLRRSRPPKQKLDSADWRLLNSLVADDALKSRLKSSFAVIETAGR